MNTLGTSNIISLRYKLDELEKFDNRFENIKNVYYNIETNKFMSEGKEISFDFDMYVDLYKEFSLSQSVYDNTTPVYQFNDITTMRNIAMNKLLTKKMYFLIENNEIKSFIMIWPYKKDNYVAIGELFVNPKYRKQGLGTLMIDFSKYISINKWNVKFVYIGVEQLNINAYNLYTKLGFKQYKNFSIAELTKQLRQFNLSARLSTNRVNYTLSK